VRVKDDAALIAALTAEISRKYGAPATPETVESGSLLLYALEPRA